MIQDIAPKKYDNHYQEQMAGREDWLMIYQGGAVLCRFEEGQIMFPKVGELPDLEMHDLTYLFTISGERFFLLKEGLAEGLPGYQWEKSVVFRNAKPQYRGFAGITGQQLEEWYRSNRFCGRCGKPMTPDHVERMMRCDSCGNMVYPKICPGVIVAVTDGNRILLTKYNRPGAVNYALVAGFTEIGETLEETVAREVMEEVGLKVKNIRYYKSQPWSFSSTLLCGFYCDVDGEKEITLDQEELAVAEWFEREDIPMEDDGVSLTREMIAQFKHKKEI